MSFEVIGEIIQVENIAIGSSIRELPRLASSMVLAAGGSGKELGESSLPMEQCGSLSYTGMNVTASAERKSKSSDSWTTEMAKRKNNRFLMCASNANYPASLEIGKIYVALPDPASKAMGLVRVIDESGEDYLYSQSMFIEVHLPQAAAEVVLSAPAGGAA